MAARARLRLGQLAERAGDLDQALERYRSIGELPGVPTLKQEAEAKAKFNPKWDFSLSCHLFLS